MLPKDLRTEIDAILASKRQQGMPTKSKFYPGAKHGWTIRGDPSDPKQAEDAADALSEMISWLNAHAV